VDDYYHDEDNFEQDVVNFGGAANAGRAPTRRTTLKGPELSDAAKIAVRNGKYKRHLDSSDHC